MFPALKSDGFLFLLPSINFIMFKFMVHVGFLFIGFAHPHLLSLLPN